MATEAPRLTVYTRSGCHLCHDMIEGLQQLQSIHAFRLETLCIDRNAVLERAYGNDVPVLVCGHRELCRHRLDTAAVTAFLSEFR